MNQKQLVISSYYDLEKISPSVKKIHFRKFISKRAIFKILTICDNIEVISLSNYAYRRNIKDIMQLIEQKRINIIIRSSKGRPNLLERVR